MAKQISNPKGDVLSVIPASLQDAAYRFAGTVESGIMLARFVVEQDPGFPDSATAATLDSLKAGFMQRYGEKNPGVWYRRTGEDVYIPSQDKGDLQVTVAYATAVSGQEFGKLRGTQPNLHALILAVREPAMAYARAMLANLQKAAKSAASATRERGAYREWQVRMQKHLDDMLVSIAKAAKRGDATVPEETKYKAAVAAFWAALK